MKEFWLSYLVVAILATLAGGMITDLEVVTFLVLGFVYMGFAAFVGSIIHRVRLKVLTAFLLAVATIVMSVSYPRLFDIVYEVLRMI